VTDANPYNAVISRRLDVHDTIARFRVRYADGRAAEFEPGQFVTLGVVDPDQHVNPDSPTAHFRGRGRRKGPRLIRRAYSIASPPEDSRELEFYVVHVPGGKFTGHLWNLREGDPLFMSERIDGLFTLDDVPRKKNLVMVSTGTGLAPFRSMYLHYRAQQRWDRFVLFDSCRYVRDFGYLDEMRELAARDDALIYLPTVTREPWDGLQGRVTLHLQPEHFRGLAGFDLDPATCHVFLCGNPGMVDDCEPMLTARGFVTRDRAHPEGNLHFERYW